MNCTLYQSLTPLERAEYMGKLVLAVQTSNGLFESGLLIIDTAERIGVFDTVKLHSDATALSDLASPVENGITTQQTK